MATITVSAEGQTRTYHLGLPKDTMVKALERFRTSRFFTLRSTHSTADATLTITVATNTREHTLHGSASQPSKAASALVQWLRAQFHLNFYRARFYLASADDKDRAGAYREGFATLLKGIDALGPDYAGARIADPSGRLIELAKETLKRKRFKDAYIKLRGALVGRMGLYQRIRMAGRAVRD